jgi:Holliday junction resolvase RusA-like endonuclease
MPFPYLPASNVSVNVVFEGEPLGKGRPRLGRGGHTYTPAKTKTYEKNLQALFVQAVGLGKADKTSSFGLRILAYRSNHLRVDLDNILKCVCDAANKVVWADDSQVVEILAKRLYDQQRPRLEILIYRILEEV